MDSFEQITATVNGIQMHRVEAGQGDPVVLLHGFPESSYSWRHQMAGLQDGWRTIAPDLRGYSRTEARGPYDTGTLQRDVLDLLGDVGVKSAHIVGHDWGGAIAWLLAMDHPEAVRSLAVLNMPHPALFRRGVLRPRQALKSWYMAFFQLPWLPERVLASDDYRRLAKGLIDACPRGTFTKDDVRTMLKDWRRQGLGGGVNYYRALLRRPPTLGNPPPPVLCPTTLVWGERDFALGKELTVGTEEFVRTLTVAYLPEAGHFVQQEAPERVTALLREHLERAGRYA